MKALFWYTVFPFIPWIAWLGTALGCFKAGVSLAWVPQAAIAIVPLTVLFTVIGNHMGSRRCNGIVWKEDNEG